MKNTMESAGRNSKAVALKLNNGKGGFYRFTAEEVEGMKSEILRYTNDDGCAWRLRLSLDIYADPFATNKVKQAAGYRKKALYNALTDGNDIPNWLEDSEPQPTNETTGEVCTLKVKIYRDRESFPDCEITEFGANGRRFARISPDAYNVGKWCATMTNDMKQWRNASYREAVDFVRHEIKNDLRKYGIKVEFVEQ